MGRADGGVAARVGARVPRLARYDALALTALVWFLAKFLRYAVPPLFGTFRRAFGVSNAGVGAAFTAMMVVYALTQFPSGALADRAGAVRVVAAGAVVAAAGAFTLAVPAGFAVVVAGMVLVGLGTGAHKTVAVGLLARTYPERTGRALGALDTLGAFGGVAAPAAVVVAVAWADWRAVFLAGGVAGVALAAAFAWRAPRRVPDASTTGVENTASLGAYATLFRRPRFAAFVGVSVCVAFAYNGVVAFLPLYLQREAGLSPAAASAVYAALFAASVVQVASGDASDRVGRLPVVAATVAVAAAALAALVALPAGAGALAWGGAAVAFGVGGHGFRPVRGAHLSALVPAEAAGGALGVARTLLMGAGALAPAVVGVVADVAGYRLAFAVLLASLAPALVAAGVLAAADRTA